MHRTSAAIGSILWLVAAPGVVCGAIPWWITRWQRPDDSWLPLDVLAGLLVVAGGLVLLHAFFDFAWHGRGTPAPPAPTEHLVVRGPFRWVRNPMYVAVHAVVLGQVIAFQSWPLAVYLGGVVLVTLLFVHAYEEPTLHRTHGAEYADYVAAVPRWVPRLPRGYGHVRQG